MRSAYRQAIRLLWPLLLLAWPPTLLSVNDWANRRGKPQWNDSIAIDWDPS